MFLVLVYENSDKYKYISKIFFAAKVNVIEVTEKLYAAKDF